jgi:2-amino-4-hydroxy-6-hydroxymethyldihydropteridine diphosphokinase
MRSTSEKQAREPDKNRTQQMVEVGFGFGSNVGDKLANVSVAIAALQTSGLVHQFKASSTYRTAPWGDVEQDWFINACAIGVSPAAPQDLLACCQTIESRMGREPTRRWGPRKIDIDILFYDDLHVEKPGLQLPHKELLNRAFVLVPLLEIRPDLEVLGVQLADALTRLAHADIERYPNP